MARATTEMPPVSLLGMEGRRLILNKATPLDTIGSEADPSVKFLQFASIVPERTYRAGIHAHYIVFGEEPRFSSGEPMRLNRKASDDMVIFLGKQSGKITYLYGLPVSELMEWSAPRAPSEMVDEVKMFSSIKMTNEDISELVPLTNTETHRGLRDQAELLMSHMPSFYLHKVRNFKDAKAWCRAGYEANIKKVTPPLHPPHARAWAFSCVCCATHAPAPPHATRAKIVDAARLLRG